MRRRSRRGRILAVTVVSACGFSASLTTGGDGGVPDAGPCQNLAAECVGDMLRKCEMIGSQPTETKCTWGCVDEVETRCVVPVPGGVLTQGDILDNPMLVDTTLGDTVVIDTDDGDITGLRTGSAMPYINGIHFFVRDNVGVYRFRNLTINGTIRGNGPFALTLVAIGKITLNGVIDMRGDCSGSNAGPGGFRGGDRAARGSGTTRGGSGGTGGSGDCSAGGGGANGSIGGSGGSSSGTTSPAGGAMFANTLVTMLVGGGGGGGGGGSQNDRGRGGGGGGAIHLFATEGIEFNGGINAGGCGGERGSNKSCGGGGGAGGAILLESVDIAFGAGSKLAVNGGGGGGGDGNATTGAGSDAELSLMRTTAGLGAGGNDGDGGSGGASEGLLGLAGENASQTGGAGGGGVGWIRFNTRSGSASLGAALISPAPTVPSTTCSVGNVPVN